MKKLLSILSIITISSSVTTTVVSCNANSKVSISEIQFEGMVGKDQKDFDQLNLPNDYSAVKNDIASYLKLDKKDIANGISVTFDSNNNPVKSLNPGEKVQVNVVIKDNAYIKDATLTGNLTIPTKKVTLDQTQLQEFVANDKNLIKDKTNAQLKQDVTNDIINGLKLNEKDAAQGIAVNDDIQNGIITLYVNINNNPYIADTTNDLIATVSLKTKITTSDLTITKANQQLYTNEWKENFDYNSDIYNLVAEQIAKSAGIKCNSNSDYYKTVTNDGVTIAVKQKVNNKTWTEVKNDNTQIDFWDFYQISCSVNANSKHFQATKTPISSDAAKLKFLFSTKWLTSDFAGYIYSSDKGKYEGKNNEPKLAEKLKEILEVELKTYGHIYSDVTVTNCSIKDLTNPTGNWSKGDEMQITFSIKGSYAVYPINNETINFVLIK